MTELARSTAIVAPKLATVVARSIENDIVKRSWPLGEVLGSEADLLVRYGVSRAVLREAVRIVEHSGVARMRRGPGGGLVVSAPSSDSMASSIGIWFSYVGVTVGEVFDALTPLLAEAVRSAAERPNAVALTLIRERTAEMDRTSAGGGAAFVDLNRRLAALSDNPVVTLFADALCDVLAARLRGARTRIDPPPTPHEPREYLHAYERLVASVSAGDVAGAMSQVEALCSTGRDRLTDSPPRSKRSAAETLPVTKMAERVALELRDDIERAGWPVNRVLGSEPELTARYDVSRAILREAVRLLENDGAVRTKRGPGGGLIVSAPNDAAIVHGARMALEYAGVSPQQLVTVRATLELAAIRMAANAMTPEVAEGLEAALEAEVGGGSMLYELHHRLADASQCRPLALFVRVLSELVERRVLSSTTTRGLPVIEEASHKAHRSIVEAVAARDAPAAQRRMYRHLVAVIDVLNPD